jgi:hypothetical protein
MQTVMIHNCKNLTTDGVSLNNANAITLTVETEQGDIQITLFDLPKKQATLIDAAIKYVHLTIDET